MNSTFMKCVAAISSLAAFLFFGNLAVIAWQSSDWWMVLACLFSFLAILGFFVCFLFGIFEIAKNFYKFMAFAVMICGGISTAFSFGEALKDTKASAGLPFFYMKIGAGQIRPVDKRVEQLANNSIISCTIGPYMKSHALIVSVTEIVYLGPVTSMLFGIAKSENKKPDDCIDLYGQLLKIQPSLEQHLTLSEAKGLRERIEARQR